MLIVRDYQHCPDSAKNCVIGLGNFDGVHKGHQALISKVNQLAEEAGVPSAIMTFEPHPIRVLKKKDVKPFRLTSEAQKMELFAHYGLDVCFCQSFTEQFSKLGGDTFIRGVLMGGVEASHIVIGYDFIFGYKRSGNAELLSSMAQECGYQFSQVVAVGDEKPFSSTRVRSLIAEGNIAEANDMLGHAFAITGKVEKGRQAGQTLGFPTANVALGDYVHPKFGVYAVKAVVGGKAVFGVANIGKRPTFGVLDPMLEVHLFDFNENLYHKEITVELIAFIRPEQRFDTLDALKAQIEQDCSAARRLLHAA